ncbi:hypothetical protein RFI_36183 [Reticulomyxa filosa]|uniref:Uncharacterized protein n=1 Tax=Reticulomyxa filosa TaxID=46433 RepID=X6LJD8_RETFI|nr:hypothetical protein RFI_36183 [Reticulomyxa filosa]|eukprot:ETO01257.1 hypothetical protein RFI_36183 [Reticulomyxa filosa]
MRKNYSHKDKDLKKFLKTFKFWKNVVKRAYYILYPFPRTKKKLVKIFFEVDKIFFHAKFRIFAQKHNIQFSCFRKGKLIKLSSTGCKFSLDKDKKYLKVNLILVKEKHFDLSLTLSFNNYIMHYYKDNIICMKQLLHMIKLFNYGCKLWYYIVILKSKKKRVIRMYFSSDAFRPNFSRHYNVNDLQFSLDSQ